MANQMMLSGLRGDCGCGCNGTPCGGNGGNSSGADDGRIVQNFNFAPIDSSARFAYDSRPDNSARFSVNSTPNNSNSQVLTRGYPPPANGPTILEQPATPEPVNFYDSPVQHLVQQAGQPWPRYAEYP